MGLIRSPLIPIIGLLCTGDMESGRRGTGRGDAGPGGPGEGGGIRVGGVEWAGRNVVVGTYNDTIVNISVIGQESIYSKHR